MSSIYERRLSFAQDNLKLLKTYKKLKEEAEAKLVTAEEEHNASLEAQKIIQSAAQATQESVHQRISKIVSEALQVVFDEPYEFKIEFVQKRGKTEAQLRFLREGTNFDPEDEIGGGVVDLAAFALRVAAMILKRPTLNRLLILDEPFKFVSAKYVPMVRQLLEHLSSKLEVQFVIVTHNEDLHAGTVIRL